MSSILRRNAINKDFSRNPQMRGSRSKFKMSNRRLQTMNGSYLVPIYLKETVPGDTFSIDMNIFTRIMPQVTAVMDKLVIKTYFFWDRNQNLWEHFENMMGMRNNPDDSIDYVVPTIEIPEGGFGVGTIFDYMNVPINTGAEREISALPFRMYNKVWNEYFRSEQLQNSVTQKNDDSDDSYTLYGLLKKNKVADYFTRNLIDTQLGEQVSIPVGTTAPVAGNGMALGLTDGTNNAGLNAVSYYLHANANSYGADVGTATTSANSMTGKDLGVTTDPTKSGLYADLSQAVSAKVIAFRQALAMQRALELDNRTGSRYTSILAGRYKTVVPDAFNNRAIYVGGSAKVLTTIPLAQTSETSETSPQGNITGNTVGSDYGKIEFSVPDFGYVLGLACISVEPQYQQGLPRMYDRKTRYDFYHPEFNGVGDQATYNSEIYLQDQDVVDDEGTPVNDLAFGYNERLAEYKTAINEICGYMRSTSALTLDTWHYGEKFENLPTNNETFIQDKAEEMIKRTLTVQEIEIDKDTKVNAPQCLFDSNFETTVYRGMPVYNIPNIAGL